MSLPKPNEPIELVAIKHRPIYGPFDYAEDNVYACQHGVETTLSVTTTKDIDGVFFDALFAWASSAVSHTISEDIKKLDQRLNEFERTRQTIRNLVDKGEL